MSALTAGSLFSGIGGFDLGLQQGGVPTAWQVENDTYARGVLTRHFPQASQYEDVTHVSSTDLAPVDVITGGFPCQDVSVAGRRAGLAGERSGLWFEFHRLLSGLKPQWVVVENVPGLLSSNAGRDFAVILHGLVQLGYGVAWRILDAQYFGLAQRRKRVFVVGHLGSGRAAQVLFERESSSGDSPPRPEARAQLAGDVAATLRSAGRNTSARVGNDVGFTVTGTLSASGAGTARTGNSRSEAAMLVYRKHGHGVYTGDRVAAPLSATDAKEGRTLATPPIGWKWNANIGWSFNDNLSPTLHNGSATAVGVRRLTPTECERLQGFPDGWTAGQSDTQRYRQLGNAVAVPVAQWLAGRIVEVTS